MYLARIKRSPFFQVIYKTNSGWNTKSTGKTIRAEAQKFLNDFIRQLNQEPDPVPKQTQHHFQKILLQDFVDNYLEFKSILHSSSYARDIKYTFKLLIESVGNVSLQNIRKDSIEKFLHSIHLTSPYAASLYYRTLRAAFNKAVEWNNVWVNPFSNIKLPRIPGKLPAFIDATDLKKILDKTTDEKMKDLFITAFLTGMRLGEVLNLRWNAVDLRNKLISVRNSGDFYTKNKKERVIPINDELLIIFRKRLAQMKIVKLDEYVFFKLPGFNYSCSYITKVFKRAVRAAELNDEIHFHTLRHSFASMLAQRGIALIVIRDLLGHNDIKTTEIYSHITAINLEEAVKNISVFGS
jgi:site-specific recombinase XerD